MQSEQFELHARLEERHWWFVARRRIMRAIIEKIAPPDGQSTVVDIGCGTGANLAGLANGYRCVGIDTSSEAIDLASARFPGMEFICGTAPADLGERIDDAAIFLLMDVLEHVPDDFEMLSTLLAAAPYGSNFLITVPANLALWSPHDVAFGHYRRYDRQRLEAVWQGLPVTVRLCSYFNTRLYPMVRAVRTFNRLSGRSNGSNGTDFKIPSLGINRFLEQTFAGEARRLLNVMDGRPQDAYRHGVSLIAVLRREAGEIEIRQRPDGIAADVYNPQQRLLEAAAL